MSWTDKILNKEKQPKEEEQVVITPVVVEKPKPVAPTPKPVAPKPKKVDYDQELEKVFNPPIEDLMSAHRHLINRPLHQNKLKIVRSLLKNLTLLESELVNLKKTKKS